MLILGIDPGTATIGYGLIRAGKKLELVEYGCLKTDPDRTTSQRLKDLADQIDELIKRTEPQAMAVEELFFAKNVTTAIKVSQARGVILLAAENHKLKIFEYTPLQIKQALTGYGRAEKKQIQQMVKMILGLKDIPRPDDAADALACSICCAHSAPARGYPQLTAKK